MTNEAIKKTVKDLLFNRQVDMYSLAELIIHYIKDVKDLIIDQQKALAICQTFGGDQVADTLIQYYAPRVGLIINQLRDKTGRVLQAWVTEE